MLPAIEKETSAEDLNDPGNPPTEKVSWYQKLAIGLQMILISTIKSFSLQPSAKPLELEEIDVYL